MIWTPRDQHFARELGISLGDDSGEVSAVRTSRYLRLLEQRAAAEEMAVRRLSIIDRQRALIMRQRRELRGYRATLASLALFGLVCAWRLW